MLSEILSLFEVPRNNPNSDSETTVHSSDKACLVSSLPELQVFIHKRFECPGDRIFGFVANFNKLLINTILKFNIIKKYGVVRLHFTDLLIFAATLYPGSFLCRRLR